jgi:hypothetical protein
MKRDRINPTHQSTRGHRTEDMRDIIMEIGRGGREGEGGKEWREVEER